MYREKEIKQFVKYMYSTIQIQYQNNLQFKEGKIKQGHSSRWGQICVMTCVLCSAIDLTNLPILCIPLSDPWLEVCQVAHPIPSWSLRWLVYRIKIRWSFLLPPRYLMHGTHLFPAQCRIYSDALNVVPSARM